MQELFDENGVPTHVPEDAFIFYMHQGYQVMYFRLTEGDNPPVYYYGEGEGYSDIGMCNPSYSSHLGDAIKGHAELMRTLAKMRAEREQRKRADN